MLDIIIDTIMDALKILPFLFIAFLIIELFEHKFSNKTRDFISKSDKFGPLFGSILGVVPQCGFSVMGTNLFITRIISLGTLISIYLSTSDEMLPVMLSSNVQLKEIVFILGIKISFAFVWGMLIDFIFSKVDKKVKNYEICDHDHCHCEDGVFKSTVYHTLSTLSFIILTTFVLNIVMEYFGTDVLSKIMFKHNIIGAFITSLIGLIPNCGASVIITELYINGATSIGALIGGLLTGSGIALLVLFKENKNFKENIFILSLVYIIGSLSGLLIDLFLILFN